MWREIPVADDFRDCGDSDDRTNRDGGMKRRFFRGCGFFTKRHDYGDENYHQKHCSRSGSGSFPDIWISSDHCDYYAGWDWKEYQICPGSSGSGSLTGTSGFSGGSIGSWIGEG
jgi:hypothetical protein